MLQVVVQRNCGDVLWRLLVKVSSSPFEKLLRSNSELFGRLLVDAAERNLVSIMCILLDLWRDDETTLASKINDTDALIVSAQRGNVGIMELLLERGADVDIRSHSDGLTTPLHAAVISNQAESVKFLLERRARVDGPHSRSFICSIQRGNVELASLLLMAGANVNSSIDGNSALAICVLNGNVPLARTLVRLGADVRFEHAETNRNLFHLASESDRWSNNLMMVRVLSRAGLDSSFLSRVDTFSLTPIDLAWTRSRFSLLYLFLTFCRSFSSTVIPRSSSRRFEMIRSNSDESTMNAFVLNALIKRKLQ